MVAICCGGGVGRTGVVLACYLVDRGRTAYQAIEEVRTAQPGSIDHNDLELSVHDYFQYRSCCRQTPDLPAAHAAMAPEPGLRFSVADSRSPPSVSRQFIRPERRTAASGSMDSARNVFLMIRYRRDEAYLQIERAICATLEEYNLVPRRADWAHADNLLWGNVCTHMEGCDFGIAVLEQLSGSEFSPNVCLEFGYMLAHRRPCLLLKQFSVPELPLPADLTGHLHKDFEVSNIGPTVEGALRAWLQELGIAKRHDERLLVFVSTGGTCRDPMAKVILQHLLGDQISGLGIRVEAMARGEPSGPSASPEARLAIQEMLGRDLLAGHRTARLTRTMTDEADLILVMDRGLLKGLPAEKSFTLKGFLGQEGDIPDPWRKSMKEYRDCAAEIQQLLIEGKDRIVAALTRWDRQGTS